MNPSDLLLCAKYCFGCGVALNTNVSTAIWNGMVCCKKCARILDPDGFKPMDKPICPHCNRSPTSFDSITSSTITCEHCSKDYCILVTKNFETYPVPNCTCGAHKENDPGPVTLGDFLDKKEYCGCLKPRPRAWTEEDEKAMREEFTVGGSCSCDGALDFGCPNCEPKQFHEWWMNRLKERIRVPVESKKCSDCQQPLSFTTGRNVVAEGELCDDCFYGKLGEEIDKNPIVGPGP